MHFGPEPALVGLAAALAGDGYRLAGEATCNDIGGNGLERSNVAVNRHIWPVSSQNALAERIGFAEADGPHSGALESDTEASDAREEIENPYLSIHSRVLGGN